MSEKKQKIWCGRGKESGQYGQIKFNICLDNIPSEFISEFQGKRYVKLILTKKREPDEKGNSHGVEVDTWKPDSSKKPAQASSTQNYGDTPEQLGEPLPF